MLNSFQHLKASLYLPLPFTRWDPETSSGWLWEVLVISTPILGKSIQYLCLILLAGFAWIKNLGRCTQTSLPPHNSSPKNLLLLFFCRKIHKTVHKNAKNSPKNRLVHSRTIAPPPIKYLIICYLILYNFVHCFSLSFLEPILILQRKSFQNNI